MRSARGGFILKGSLQVYLSRAPPPMGNRNRTIELSTVPVRAHCPSGEGRHNAIYYFQYSLCPPGHTGLYEILRKSEAYFKLCCGQNRIRIRSAHGSYYESRDLKSSYPKVFIIFGWFCPAGKRAMAGSCTPLKVLVFTMV